MRQASVAAALITMAAAISACRERKADAAQTLVQSEVLADREARLANSLAAPESASTANEPLAKWFLPPALKEVSGLALTPDGRLLAHNDEYGTIFVLDPRRGVLLKHFMLGERTVFADFEGITVAGDVIYLLKSNGDIYQFKEGGDGSHVKYTVHETKLGRECEFEGVAFEPDSARLIMPCKNIGQKSLRDKLVIYRWRTDPARGLRVSLLTIPLATVVGSNRWKSLNPSDITIDPATGNYVIISGQEKALVEITPGGKLVRSLSLPRDLVQPEGVAITKDNVLIVSDEAVKTPATITLYRWPIGQTVAASAVGVATDSNTTDSMNTRSEDKR